MIVSWNWLKEYVDLSMTQADLEERLTLCGLNHEGTEKVGDDLAIDLEVTSNRPDCLGHIGVAREVAVLWGSGLKIPASPLKESSTPVTDLAKVRIDCEDICFRYTARVIKGVKVGPSPDWLANRLETLGIAVINNIVDITNYVMMECAQPLHAFDLAKLKGSEIIVRRANKGEKFTAIDHKEYELDERMCVIADAERAVALGGVMGGEDSEVSADTVDLLIEAADFDPVSVRTAARKLILPSPSSYRFERGVDPEGVDWASRRACELILELAGGELAAGSIEVGQSVPVREPLVLRLSQLPRILGIEISADEVKRILVELGCQEEKVDSETVTVVPPQWRRDLTREIDLVEEVARIYGYDKIPEDAGVKMAPSHRDDEDRVIEKVRQVMSAASFDEAMTASVVSEEWSGAFSPWSDQEPIQASTPMLRGADRLRRSLVPSLLNCRKTNEALGNATAELFEIAKIYLPQSSDLPFEEKMLTLVSGNDFSHVKGVVGRLVNWQDRASQVEATPLEDPLFAVGRACKLSVGGQALGVLGEVSAAGLKKFGLRKPATVAELRLPALEEVATLIPTYRQPSAFPAMTRDINLIVDEKITWAELEALVRESGGELVVDVNYVETFRDIKRDGAGKKRLLLSFALQSDERTLTKEEGDALREEIVAACSKATGAALVS